MVARRVGGDAAGAEGGQPLALDEAEDGAVGAAGLEGADLLEGLAFEEEVEDGRGAAGALGRGEERIERVRGQQGRAVDVGRDLARGGEDGGVGWGAGRGGG